MHRDTLITTCDGYPIELLTISSMAGIRANREENIDGLFPDPGRFRSHGFDGKKVR